MHSHTSLQLPLNFRCKAEFPDRETEIGDIAKSFAFLVRVVGPRSTQRRARRPSPLPPVERRHSIQIQPPLFMSVQPRRRRRQNLDDQQRTGAHLVSARRRWMRKGRTCAESSTHVRPIHHRFVAAVIATTRQPHVALTRRPTPLPRSPPALGRRPPARSPARP